MSEQIIRSAISIILHTGDTRVACKEALDAISEADFKAAEVKLKETQAEVTGTRKVQTDAVQGEVRGDKSEYSLLFAYAQDTLVTIYSETSIAKQPLKIFSAYEKRISTLESRDCQEDKHGENTE